MTKLAITRAYRKPVKLAPCHSCLFADGFTQCLVYYLSLLPFLYKYTVRSLSGLKLRNLIPFLHVHLLKSLK